MYRQDLVASGIHLSLYCAPFVIASTFANGCDFPRRIETGPESDFPELLQDMTIRAIVSVNKNPSGVRYLAKPLPDRPSASKKSTTTFGWSVLWIMICDLETRVLEPIKNPLGLKVLLSPERSVKDLFGLYTLRHGGGGGIRTPETLTGLTVFKTAGFNRSPTPPLSILLGNRPTAPTTLPRSFCNFSATGL